MEYDIAAQARTQDDLLYELERILVGRIHVSAAKGRQPFENLPKAPSRYWAIYEEAEPISTDPLPFRQGDFQVLPGIELRAA